MFRLPIFAFCILVPFGLAGENDSRLKALVVDGRNNHDWRSTTDHLRATLEATGRFEVAVSTAPELRFPRVPHRARNPEDEPDLAEVRDAFEESLAVARDDLERRWEEWSPDFAEADVVVLNYNGDDWPTDVRERFLEFVRNGGGVVLVHAANNAFRNWPEFNELIGLGWRPSPIGRAIKIDPETGKSFLPPESDLPNGGNSGHGSKHPFAVTVRAADHPVMEGLPPVWMHASDELYHNMRGPAQSLTVLSSAWSDPSQRGSGFHEPLTWEVRFGEGRAIVTSLGHLWPGGMERGEQDAFRCVGFQTVFARSCEYVATGEVTLPVPERFPSATAASAVAAHEVRWSEKNGEPVESSALEEMHRRKKADPYAMLSPEEELATFELAPGYVAELFAAEPMVQEPVLTVWDSDGAMYVAEMRSYMQDADGTGTKTLRNGRIKRLVDRDGDGRADEATVFLDDLNLPRMILPLAGGWIAIRETDTMNVVAWRDSGGDGVADESRILYERGPDGRNHPDKSVEHQDSGLIWNLDNHIYISYNAERYRFTDGEWLAEKQRGHWTQWGLTRDDAGDLYWITNTDPLTESYLHPRYWGIPGRVSEEPIPQIPVVLPPPYDPGFLSAYSTCLLNDRGGPAEARRGFTSACGQSVYRSDKYPVDARGNYFFCDPTIHVVRRARISREGGLVRLAKADDGETEFLRSSDINSRFVNTAEGPDGCLYVTDMYRGIIQDAPWLNPEAREAIRRNGLADNNQHGRIWRIRHRDFAPRGESEILAMGSESTAALLRHFENPAGWWRDTAQREILLRDDRESVAGMLAAMVRFSENPLCRLHALWTLEGMSRADFELLRHASRDGDSRIRRAVVQVGEVTLSPEQFLEAVARPLSTDSSPVVAKQLILSSGYLLDPSQTPELIEAAARRHPGDQGVQLAATLALWERRDLSFVRGIEEGTVFDSAQTIAWKNSLGNWDRCLRFPEEMPDSERRRIISGETIYFRNCVSCHGPDGKGIDVPGIDAKLAPSLVDSARVAGDPAGLIPVFLQGLSGPIDGATYQAGFMAPAAAMGIVREDRLAELISYLRFLHGDGTSSVSKEDVVAAKRLHEGRVDPWTDAELDALEP